MLFLSRGNSTKNLWIAQIKFSNSRMSNKFIFFFCLFKIVTNFTSICFSSLSLRLTFIPLPSCTSSTWTRISLRVLKMSLFKRAPVCLLLKKIFPHKFHVSLAKGNRRSKNIQTLSHPNAHPLSSCLSPNHTLWIFTHQTFVCPIELLW